MIHQTDLPRGDKTAESDPGIGDQVPATVGDFRGLAQAAVGPEIWDFLEGGAGREETLAANVAAFARYRLRPRVMGGVGSPELSTTFLGRPLALPVLTAPVGADRLFHPEGQVAIARANADAGIVSIVPELCSFSLEEVAQAAPAAARIFQVHPLGRIDDVLERIARADAAGYQAICVTVDCPPTGWRDRNLRNSFAVDPATVTANFPGDASDTAATFAEMFRTDVRRWSWREFEQLAAASPLPLVAKGVLTAEDAIAAVDAGAAAVIVSNHGGRQLDGSVVGVDQLAEVVPAVGGRVAVGVDGGVRSATDILKALALGADVVVLGRLSIYAVAAAGERGVRRLWELLDAELRTAMCVLGRERIAELDAGAVQAIPGT